MTSAPVLFSQPLNLFTGLMFGVLFGFLLQRGHILRYEKQLNLLRFKDMTVLKYMLSAALAGMAGTALLRSFDLISVGQRPVFLGQFIIGGIIFGLGWAIVGYCPGTQLGAIGEGRNDGFWAFLGGWAGALAFYPFYPHVIRLFAHLGRLNAYNLDLVFGLSPWVITCCCALLFIPLFVWFERRGV